MNPSIFRHFTAIVIACAATVVTVASVASPAQAQTPSVRVSAAGIDLSEPAGQARLQAMVRQAARAACGTRDAFDLQGREAAARCFHAAIAGAEPRVQRLAERARSERLAAAPAPAATTTLR